MPRWRRYLAVTACLALAAGCTTTRPGSRIGDTGLAVGEALDRSFARLGSRRVARPAVERASSNPESGFGGEPAIASVAGEPPPRPARPTLPDSPEPDSETRSLIAAELADATPDERETLLAAFRDLPPESVERILKARRMGLESSATPYPASAQPTAMASALRDGATAARPRAAPSGRRRPGGIGTVDPWGTAPPNRRGIAAAGAAGAEWPSEDGPRPRVSPGTSAGAESSTVIAAATLIAPPQVEVDDVWIEGAGAARQTQNTSAKGGAIAESRHQAAADRASPSGAAATLPADSARGPASARQPLAAARNIVNQAAAVAMGFARKPEPEPQPAPLSPVEAVEPPPEQLARLISATEAEVTQLEPGEDESSRRLYVERHVHLRMLYLIARQNERALMAIPGVDAADQEFWQQIFWGLTNYFDAASMPADSDRATQTVSQLSNAVLRLQARASLELGNVSFCHKIASFGNYEKYPRDEFTPGQEVLLYAEVANIHSAQAHEGKFRTSMKSTLEIYRHGAEGEPVDRIELPETIDLCGSHRRDYFHSYQFTIPGRLSPGPHVLKLLVEDQISRRTATYAVNFTVK
ncbi:MAG: hypothetical protein ACT4QC_19540 [Planctomycetaceae bacterium]